MGEERHAVFFEFEKQLMDLLGHTVKKEDETVGFRYFDELDVPGLADGTANSIGSEVSIDLKSFFSLKRMT